LDAEAKYWARRIKTVVQARAARARDTPELSST